MPSADTSFDGDRRIVRDATFTRAVVDDIVPIHLGRDIELSCLQFSPLLNAMIDGGDHYVADADPVYAEVARIRINFGEAIELAMTLLQQGILAKRVRGDRVAKSILEWTQTAMAADETEDKGRES